MTPTRALTILFILCIPFGASAAHTKQLQGTIVAIGPVYGNIDTSFVPGDLQSLGIKQGDTFQAGSADKRVDVYLGETYSDVPKGDWVAFITARGNLRIAKNLDNAAKALGVKQGDTITLYR